MKKIDLDKADVVKQEVCSRDEVMHVGKNRNGLVILTKFKRRARVTTEELYEYSEEVGER